MTAHSVAESGERERIKHALARMEDCVKALRIALAQDAPIGFEAPSAVMSTAQEVLVHSAAADAYRRAGGR